MDRYFTPAGIALRLVAPYRRNESCVADFAAGNGELLRAAAAKWPDTTIVATDIHRGTVSQLRRRYPDWHVGQCDFLKDISRKRCVALGDLVGKVSLALLNPPFSCRGNERIVIDLGEERRVSCSRAMAFVLTSLRYLTNKGRVAAVLPAGCLTSEKDIAAWRAIRERYSVTVRGFYGVRTFERCAARTVLVSIGASQRISDAAGQMAPRRKRVMKVRLIRGAMPMHEATNGLAGPEWPLVHTTDLRDGSVCAEGRCVSVLGRYVVGPAILLPRVGQPDVGKCALYLARRRLALSDCVFALSCRNRSDAERLCGLLRRQWDRRVAPSFGGTCAPYITVKMLSEVLESLGCELEE
jgi:tRNA1(Val) A37 N6-methylase TrmN6